MAEVVIMNASLNDSLPLLGQEVPLGRVDRALKQFWESDEAKTRASLMNFAIYGEQPEALDQNNKLLEQITAEHSCRALLILCVPREGGVPRARAWINALCRPYQGKLAVCSEQISFVLEGGDAALVQNIVFAHLDSDLPLVVWWQGDLTSNFEERFYSEIDRLIIDSAQWCDAEREFAMLEDAYHGDTSDFEVHDLEWTRSHFFRAALASCFQDAVALARLPKTEVIEIMHGRGHRIAALLLGAWIAERMGCVLDRKAKGIQFTKPGGGAITLTVSEGGGHPVLSSLVVKGPGLRAEVSRDGDSPFVNVCGTCGGHTHEEMLPADVEGEADLISTQLSRAHGTSLFIGMVPMLRAMLKK
jgi:glucose-6-phosphate dehydrogenase assembly protein OpcA